MENKKCVNCRCALTKENTNYSDFKCDDCAEAEDLDFDDGDDE